MILKRHLLLLLFLLLAYIVNGQDFKVIKETDDYILKEVDSGYYYNHEIKAKNNFVFDTTNIHKVDGVLRLPLDNGKEVVFKDTMDMTHLDIRNYKLIENNNKLNSYMIEGDFYERGAYYLINKKTGLIDTLYGKPIYSPSNKFYGYTFAYKIETFISEVRFKNIISNKKNIITFDYELPYKLKWIDDNTFIFYTNYWNTPAYKILYNKYYLVEIKK